jgi:CubicO group peptidase (beta-lactamase class C family)
MKIFREGKRSAIAITLVVLGTSTSVQADKTDDFVQAQMAERNIPGLSLAVVKDSQIIKARGYGLANVELSVAATPQTVYPIGSMTKQFTATAIMMLMEEGKLALTDEIAKYLPNAPETWKDITIRHLLNHTSGIKSFTDLPVIQNDESKSYTKAEIVALFSGLPLEFQPGEKWYYNDGGYFLLGMIIEEVSGKNYEEFLSERIFRPLGMTNTRANDPDRIIPKRADGYILRDSRLCNGRPVSPAQCFAGGDLISTVLDLAKWDAALYSEKLLKKSSLELMWTPTKLNTGQTAIAIFGDKVMDDSYGFAWFLGIEDKHRHVQHGGAISSGFNSCIFRFVDDWVTVIVLSNRFAYDFMDVSAPRAWDIAKGVGKIYISSVAAHRRTKR